MSNYLDDLDAELAAAMAATNDELRTRTYATSERLQAERAAKRARQRRLDKMLARIQETKAEAEKNAAQYTTTINDDIAELEGEVHALELAGRQDRADEIARIIQTKRNALDAIAHRAEKHAQRVEQQKNHAIAQLKQQEADLTTEAISELTQEIAQLEAILHPSFMQKKALMSKRAMLARRKALVENKAGLTVPMRKSTAPRMTKARRVEALLKEIGAMRDAGAPAVEIAHKFRTIAAIRDGHMTYAEQKETEKRLAREAKAKARADEAREKAYRKRQRAKRDETLKNNHK